MRPHKKCCRLVGLTTNIVLAFLASIFANVQASDSVCGCNALAVRDELGMVRPTNVPPLSFFPLSHPLSPSGAVSALGNANGAPKELPLIFCLMFRVALARDAADHVCGA